MVDGDITLYQEFDSEVRHTTIRSGEAIINPPGVWHTADVDGTAKALFITAGMGPRIGLAEGCWNPHPAEIRRAMKEHLECS